MHVLANINASAATRGLQIGAGEGNNTVTVNNGYSNTIYAGAGNDTITTENGIDVINAGDGENVITTGRGRKTITVGDYTNPITKEGSTITLAGNNYSYSPTTGSTITAGNGNDTIKVAEDSYTASYITVNAGEGNGKPWDWYDEHKKPSNGYDPDYRPFPDAESDRDLWNRIKPFYEEIIASPDEKILIVSHGCLLGFLQAMLMGFEFDDLKKARFSGRSGSISRFDINDEGRVTAAYINRRAG